MGKKLYVGNLSYSMTDGDLVKLFEPHGSVTSAQVIMDRDTGRSKGFGFVEMGSDQEAQAAIAAMNGAEVDGRTLTVNEARPKTDGPRGGGGGGGGRGGYGGGGGGGRGGLLTTGRPGGLRSPLRSLPISTAPLTPARLSAPPRGTPAARRRPRRQTLPRWLNSLPFIGVHVACLAVFFTSVHTVDWIM